MKSFFAILSGALIAAAVAIIGFGIYNLFQTQAQWPEEKPELPAGPSAGILYVILGVGLLTLVLIQRSKK